MTGTANPASEASPAVGSGTSAGWQHRRPQRFLIYLSLANKHRGPIAHAIAQTLANGGHRVVMVCEPQTALRLGEQVKVLLSHHEKHIESFRSIPNVHVVELDCFAGATAEGLARANQLREEKLCTLLPELRPDWVIVWNGRFNYQAGLRRALGKLDLTSRTLFMEVAWFSQKEYVYFDTQGVNSLASFVGRPLPPLTLHQAQWLDAWLCRYRISRFGRAGSKGRPKHVFVPLQVDTDTSVMTDSPFASMKEFIAFLERWLPADYSATIKLHPKATYEYVPASRRRNFQVLVEGSIDDYIDSAETVVGINSTVLLEAAALGKRVVSFGRGLFSGTESLWETSPEVPAAQVLGEERERRGLRPLLYHLVARRQVSLQALAEADYDHLASREPFINILDEVPSSGQYVAHRAREGNFMLRVGNSRIAKTAQLDVERGGRITVGDDSEIRHHAVLEISGRYQGQIEIGNHSVVGIGCWLQGSGTIRIGDDVLIGPYTSIVSTNHSYENVEVPIARQPLVTGEVTIEDDVWIGAHCTILSNVRIGAHSIVGANSLVTRDIPPYSIAVGTPAKVIKARR